MNISTLSRLCELSGGLVEKVGETNLTGLFDNMISKPIIASNVVTKVKLHKGLKFRNEMA